MYDFAVIGFGAIGASFLRQLHSQIYEQDIRPIKVAIISPAQSFSSGLAFGQADSFHKVNTLPELMGIDPEDPQGFATWMRHHLRDNERYPARLTYSDYLKHIYQSLNNDQKLDITGYHAVAIDIDIIPDRQNIRLDHGLEVSTQRTVLTLGSVSSPTFDAAPGFEPIMPKAVSKLESPSSALVAGTGLTAVDCVRSLVRKGCSSIHMFSRNGFAPTVISSSARYSPKYFTWHNLKRELSRHKRGNRLPSIIRLLRRELGHMQNPEVFFARRLLKDGNLCGYWDYLLERSAQARLPFQDTLGSTRYFAHKIWRKLSEEERLTFQRSFGAFWACWRHPIPVEVIQELNQYAREGRLHIHRPVAPLKRRDGKYVLETPHKIVKAEVLVDGTGGSTNMKKAPTPLIQNLLAKGLARPHPCGGLRVDNLTYALCNENHHSKIYCLGPLTKGELFSTNAFWFNSHCVSNLAHYFAIEMRLESRMETSI